MRSVFTPSSKRRYRLFAAVCILFISWTFGGPAAAGSYVSALERPAIPVDQPEKRVLLDIDRAGDRLVSVGERGLIIVSDDGGENWTQARVPVSVTLTAVAFVTAKKGWATGHWGVVLNTEDGGSTWTRQLDGRAAAAIELEAAQKQAEQNGIPPEAPDQRLMLARMLVNEGPDKPFLALHFLDEKTGFIIGAYGLIFRTDDGGSSWTSIIGQVENPRGMHLYVMDGNREELWLAGEKGFVAVSRDGGETFTQLDSPSKGSFFGGCRPAPGQFVAAGLQGKAFRTLDGGKTFEPIQLPAPVSINAVSCLGGTSLVLLSQSGQVLESTDSGRTVRPLDAPAMPPLAAIVESSADLIAVGMGGVIKIAQGRNLLSQANGVDR